MVFDIGKRLLSFKNCTLDKANQKKKKSSKKATKKQDQKLVKRTKVYLSKMGIYCSIFFMYFVALFAKHGTEACVFDLCVRFPCHTKLRHLFYFSVDCICITTLHVTCSCTYIIWIAKMPKLWTVLLPSKEYAASVFQLKSK